MPGRYLILHCYAGTIWDHGSLLWKNILALDDEEWTIRNICCGEPVPTADECHLWDGIIITGSQYGAYDQKDWIQQLQIFIQACHIYALQCPKHSVPRPKIVGGCFGSQILAASLGGRVERQGFFVLRAEELQLTHTFIVSPLVSDGLCSQSTITQCEQGILPSNISIRTYPPPTPNILEYLPLQDALESWPNITLTMSAGSPSCHLDHCTCAHIQEEECFCITPEYNTNTTDLHTNTTHISTSSLCIRKPTCNRLDEWRQDVKRHLSTPPTIVAESSVSRGNVIAVTGGIVDTATCQGQLMDTTTSDASTTTTTTTSTFSITIPTPSSTSITSFSTSSTCSSSSSSVVPTLRIIESHGDYVVHLPPNACLLASSSSCKHEIWAVQNHILAMQCHPEFDAYGCISERVWKRRVSSLPKEAAYASALSFTLPRHEAILLEVVRRFIKGERPIQ